MITGDMYITHADKVYSYKLSDLVNELVIFGCIPIAGAYLTYFAISRELDILLIIIAITFNILLLSPVLFIILKSKQKIIISENGIIHKKICKSTYIAWSDIDSIEYDTIVSSFSQSRFSKPKDLIIKSKHGDVVYVMESLVGFYEVKQLVEAKEKHPFE